MDWKASIPKYTSSFKVYPAGGPKDLHTHNHLEEYFFPDVRDIPKDVDGEIVNHPKVRRLLCWLAQLIQQWK